MSARPGEGPIFAEGRGVVPSIPSSDTEGGEVSGHASKRRLNVFVRVEMAPLIGLAFLIQSNPCRFYFIFLVQMDPRQDRPTQASPLPPDRRPPHRPGPHRLLQRPLTGRLHCPLRPLRPLDPPREREQGLRRSSGQEDKRSFVRADLHHGRGAARAVLDGTFRNEFRGRGGRTEYADVDVAMGICGVLGS